MPRNGKRTQEALETVIDWFDDRGFDVIFKRGADSQLNSNGEVLINSSSSLEHQLCILLHEAGHAIVQGRKNYKLEYEYGYPVYNLRSSKKCKQRLSTLRHRTDVYKEEVAAWNAGRELAMQLELPIKIKTFARIESLALSSYAKWVVDWYGEKTSL